MARFFLLLTLLLTVTSAAIEARPGLQNRQLEMAARLQSDGLTQCWDSLMELRSCTGEVILFFLNGETYLGPSCCRAIRVIEHRCWAAQVMLAALGLTPEEGDVLREYCDAETGGQYSPPFPPPPSPPAAPGPERAGALGPLVLS